MTLVPEGSYRLEATLAAIAKLKLIERPGGLPDTEEAKDVSAEAETQEALVQLGKQRYRVDPLYPNRDQLVGLQPQ